MLDRLRHARQGSARRRAAVGRRPGPSLPRTSPSRVLARAAAGRCALGDGRRRDASRRPSTTSPSISPPTWSGRCVIDWSSAIDRRTRRRRGDRRRALGAGYRQWKSERIEPVSRQHLAAAFTLGAYRASPDDASLRWLVDDDEGACPDCDDNALAGPTLKGATFPTGQTYPPAHAAAAACSSPPRALERQWSRLRSGRGSPRLPGHASPHGSSPPPALATGPQPGGSARRLAILFVLFLSSRGHRRLLHRLPLVRLRSSRTSVWRGVLRAKLGLGVVFTGAVLRADVA